MNIVSASRKSCGGMSRPSDAFTRVTIASCYVLPSSSFIRILSLSRRGEKINKLFIKSSYIIRYELYYEIKMAVFGDVAPCSLVDSLLIDVSKIFTDVIRALPHRPDDGSSKLL
jgi:hypothetical protein